MNYFEFYELPVSFSPDQGVVKKKFYALSKAYHPDFHVNESEERQREILDLSTLNNKAFQTLSDRNKLVPYVLELYGELSEGEKYDLPKAFLMEMMEVNEALMELEFDFDADKLKQIETDVKNIEKNLDDESQNLFSDFEQVNESDKLDVLEKNKGYSFS